MHNSYIELSNWQLAVAASLILINALISARSGSGWPAGC